MKILTNKMYDDLKNEYSKKADEWEQTARIFVEQCSNYEETLKEINNKLKKIKKTMKKDDIMSHVKEIKQFIESESVDYD